MKKQLIPFLAFAALTFLFTACQKENIEANSDATIAQSNANAEDMIESVSEEAEYRMAATQSTTCPTITWAQARGLYPNTATIDFGSGCPAQNGRVLAGQIIVSESADFYSAGATRIVETNGLTVDGNSLEFQRTLSNLGISEANGLMSWSVEVAGTKIKSSDGKTVTWTASRLRTMLEGLETPETRTDDVFEITGSASGTCSEGHSFNATITSPLIRRVACQWIESGVITFESEGHRGNRSLDFGDGTCDDKATVTLANGQTREITIRRK